MIKKFYILDITPHLAASTKATRDNMSITAAMNILCALAGEKMCYPAY
jgi:phosphoglycerate dehydrogenase-like enzyme